MVNNEALVRYGIKRYSDIQINFVNKFSIVDYHSAMIYIYINICPSQKLLFIKPPWISEKAFFAHMRNIFMRDILIQSTGHHFV